MNITVVGAGTVGLATAAVMSAKLGHATTLIERDAGVLAMLADGRLPVDEPEMAEMLAYAQRDDLFGVAPDCQSCGDAEIVFVCVGTPPTADGSADLSDVEAALDAVRECASADALIVIRSTVPPGTCRALGCCANPEFLRMGHAIRDAWGPDRIVIGADAEADGHWLRDLWEPLGAPIFVTDTVTAELSKYAANCFLATKISYINAMREFGDQCGADIDVVADIMGADPRIGRWGLDAGLGYGGPCLPKDVRALECMADADLEAPTPTLPALLQIVQTANHEALTRVLDAVMDAVGGCLRGKEVVVLGESFKPGVRDERGSQPRKLAQRLVERGADVLQYGPTSYTDWASERDLFAHANCIVIAVPCSGFAELEYPKDVPVVDPWRLLKGVGHAD